MYLRVFFPSGRYYAARAEAPCFPEWPPHPSRLFSALVASAYTTDSGINGAKHSVLEWLERQPPPCITAPSADLSEAPVCYVPPGDITGRKGKKGEEDYEHGVNRWRQPRNFPCATILGNPEVCYSWHEDPCSEELELLDGIAAGISHIGTSHSFAVAKISSGQMPETATLFPEPGGKNFLRIAAPGRLKELDLVFSRNSGVRRSTPACEPLVAYRYLNEESHPPLATFSSFIILRISGTMHGADTSPYLSKALRRAVMSVLGDEAPPSVHGHGKENHIGWLPLPDVGHAYASGRIVGIGIAMPSDLSFHERQSILAAIKNASMLRLPDGRVANLSVPLPGERVPLALEERTWTRPSSSWATVTPVVLDRPPKRASPERNMKAMLQSLEFAGLPEPEKIEISGFSMFNGAPPAFTVPVDKPRYHVFVRFREEVRGPVIAGRLRFFGLGLFRPVF